MGKGMRFRLLLFLLTKGRVLPDSEKPTALSLTFTCRGQRVFTVSLHTRFFQSCFSLHLA